MSIFFFYTATKASSRRTFPIASFPTGWEIEFSKRFQPPIRQAHFFASICALGPKARQDHWRGHSRAWKIIMPGSEKLGRGGIREIEFIVQTLQLIHGARHPFLQEPNMLKALRALRQLDLLPRDEVLALDNTYRLLRRVEHRLQIEAEQQTHVVPRDPEALRRLAFSLRFLSSEDFTAALQARMRAVRPIFQRIISETSAAPTKSHEMD